MLSLAADAGPAGGWLAHPRNLSPVVDRPGAERALAQSLPLVLDPTPAAAPGSQHDARSRTALLAGPADAETTRYGLRRGRYELPSSWPPREKHLAFWIPRQPFRPAPAGGEQP